MANQITINIGAAANDGTGDPLRTAFNDVNLNFANVWNTGLPNSNIQFSDNRILTVNTNANLVLAPNGIGKVASNVDIVPNTSNAFMLGSTSRRWNSVYSQYINVSEDFILGGDLTVGGNLTVTGNIIEMGNIVTDALTLQLANTAGTGNAANGSGITVGANDNIATMLYNSSSNVWALNIGLSTGNLILVDDRIMDLYGPSITNADLVSGSTSGLDIVPNGDANATVLYNTYGNIQLQTSNTGSNVKTFTFGYDGNLSLPGISATGNITGNYFFGNGSQLTGITSYANANAVAYGESGWAGNIIPSGNAVYSLGNATNQWKSLYVSNTTIYINNVPISLTAGNVLTVDGNDVVTTNANGQTSLGNLSVDDNNIYNTNGQGVVISNFSFIAEAETAYVQIPAGNSASNLNVVQEQGNVRIAASGADWTFDTTGNLTIPNGGYINFVNTGGITQAVNEDLRFTVSDDEQDGWAIQSTVNDGAGTDLTRMQVRYDGVRINTDLPTNNYSWDFRDSGEFDVPKSIRGPVGGNLVVSIGDQPSSNTFIDLQTRSYVGDALISNVRIANPNVTVSTSSGAHTWTFDGTGQMTLAGTPAIVKTIDDGYAFSGFISGISLTNPVIVDLTDNVFGDPESGKVTIFNVNGTTQANGTWYFLAVETNQFALYYDADQEQPVDGTGWTAWTSGGQAVAYGQHDMTLIGGNIMLTAEQNGVTRDFSFGSTGNLTLPLSGLLVGATANNNGYLNWFGNSSGDGGGYTTLRLVPDDTRESADQYLIIDPTAPGHIHIRAGGTQDNSSADLFLGGENSYFKVPAGANNEVRISANSYPWVFGADSTLTVPGEGIIRSIQDTVILQSYDISGNTYSARLGTNGGLYFETSDYPLGWLNLTNNAGNANISSPGGSINIDAANGTSGAAGKDINITAGDADQTDYYTTAGGDVNIQGGMGAFNDGGGGGPGGNINLVAGTSADPAGHTGNINITSGVNNWVFDYSGAVNLPGGTGVIESYANNISIYSDAGQLNGALFYDTGSEIYALQDFAIFTDNANASHIWRFYANSAMIAPGNITTTANISAGYFIGDGSQLTGLPASYSDSNVATFLAAYGSNTVSTTGNITAGNFIGAGTNVDIVAGSYTWVFDNTGNLTTPGNITVANVVTANTFVSNAFNVVTAGNLSITSQYGLGFTGTILEDNGTLELIAKGGGAVVAGWDSTYGNGLGNIATINFNEVGGEGIVLRTGNRAATEYNWNFDNTGNLTAPGNITGNTGGYTIGYRDIPQVTFSANATAALTDAGKHFYSTTAGNLALTLPDNSSVAFPTGATLTIVVNAAGNVLVNQGTGVSLYMAGSATTGNRTVGAYGLASVMKVAANTWVISGTGVY